MREPPLILVVDDVADNVDILQMRLESQGYEVATAGDGVEALVVELKAVEAILPVHRGQLLSYLRLGGFRLGYLLNFHVARMRDGVVKMVNGI